MQYLIVEVRVSCEALIGLLREEGVEFRTAGRNDGFPGRQVFTWPNGGGQETPPLDVIPALDAVTNRHQLELTRLEVVTHKKGTANKVRNICHLRLYYERGGESAVPANPQLRAQVVGLLRRIYGEMQVVNHTDPRSEDHPLGQAWLLRKAVPEPVSEEIEPWMLTVHGSRFYAQA